MSSSVRYLVLIWFGLVLISREECNAAVISIDFSSEWLKIALVKPGVPMEIVLNKESKRKTAAVVALRNEERTFSDHALTVAVKYPRNAYQYLQFLTGLSYDNPLVSKYREWFPYYDIRRDDERGTVLFQHDEDTVFSPEELLGMLFNQSRELAQDYAGTNIRDVVITIPAFFTQAQRKTVANAAKLVGLNVLQLITDGAAVALNFGLYRQSTFNNTPFYIMFYDMGATSTIATIAEFKKTQVREGSVAHLHPQVRIKGVGFDRTLGGLEMEMRLRDYLAQSFMSKHKTSDKITESPRAMAKLLKEAKRVKKVLSANTEIFAQVEGLFEDIDFKTKVTRTEFEDLCSDLFDRIAQPVQQALRMADITLGEIESVVLVGGGTRVPKVQEMLLKAVEKTELGKNINTDEAAALGAVYQGASLSKQFRVKKFVIKDANVYPIQVSFEKHSFDDDGKPMTKTVTRTLFGAGNSYPQKKVLTFNRYSEDFDFDIFYGDISFLTEQDQRFLGNLNLTKVHLEGVERAIVENPDGQTSGIKVHFRMDDNGILLLESTQSLFEYPDLEEESTFSKLKSAFSNLFGGSETKSDSDKETEQDTTEQKEEKEPAGEDTSSKEAKIEETADKATVDEEKETETTNTDKESEPEESSETEKDEEETEEKEVPSEDTPSDMPLDTPSDTPSEDEGNTSEEETDKEEEPSEVPLSEEEQEEEINEQATPTENTTTTEPKEPTASSNETTPTEASANRTSKASDQKTVKKDSIKTKTVKVNLTHTETRLDLPELTENQITASKTKLQWLQQRDEDKRENERSKNSLESHVFETQDRMYSEEIVTHSTEEERKTILDALRVTRDWLEEEGYEADTDTYKQKLRELKRLSRPILRRLKEAKERPKLLHELLSSLNRSYGMILYMRNMTEEIFTKVEIKSLEDLTMETLKWLKEAEAEQNATKPYEDPVLRSSDIQEKIDKVNREVMYLINKARNYKPPKPKAKPKTNSTKKANSSSEQTTPIDATPPPEPEEIPDPPPDTISPSEENHEENPDSENQPVSEEDNGPEDISTAKKEKPLSEDEGPSEPEILTLPPANAAADSDETHQEL